MEQAKIDRINALARKAKTEGLTDAERAEQAALRQEYREGFLHNLRTQLDNTYVMDPESGEKRRLKE